MRKREKDNLKGKRGFTLLETVTVVAIVAIMAAIAVPVVGSMREGMTRTRENSYAKAVFSAVESRLIWLRSQGELDVLEGAEGAMTTEVEGEYFMRSDAAGFGLLLPAGAVEDTVAKGYMLVRYRPSQAAVCAVYYRESDGEFDPSALPAVEDCGYYAGEPATAQPADAEIDITAEAELVGEALAITVPLPEGYTDEAGAAELADCLQIEVVIRGGTEAVRSATVLARGCFETALPQYTYDAEQGIGVRCALDGFKASDADTFPTAGTEYTAYIYISCVGTEQTVWVDCAPVVWSTGGDL